MMRREKDILLTLSSIGATGLLVYFFNAGETGEVSLQENTRARRDIKNNLCFDGDDCTEWGDAEDFEFFNDLDIDNDVDFFQQDPRAKKKKTRKPKANNNDVDYSNFWKEDVAKTSIDDAVAKAVNVLAKWHNRYDPAGLAQLSPDAEERDLNSFDMSAGTTDHWADAAENGAQDCSLSAQGRVTSATQAVFYLFPQDIIYDSSVDQEALMRSYRSFGVSLAENINDGTKFVVGSYNTLTTKQTLSQVSKASDAGTAIDGLQTKFNVPTITRKGQTQVRMVQSKYKNLLGSFTAPGTRNKYFRRADDGIGQSCQAFIVFHGLPMDYKDIVDQKFDFSMYQKRCNIVPIFITTPALESYFGYLAANFRGLTNSIFTSTEKAFRGYILTSPEEFMSSTSTFANQLVSYACSCETRQACHFARPSYIAELEESLALTTAATTTEGTTTSAYSTSEGTTQFTTTADFRGIDETEGIPVDKRCCGLVGDLGGLKYDQNRQFCCNDGEAFYVSDEVC